MQRLSGEGYVFYEGDIDMAQRMHRLRGAKRGMTILVLTGEKGKEEDVFKYTSYDITIRVIKPSFRKNDRMSLRANIHSLG